MNTKIAPAILAIIGVAFLISGGAYYAIKMSDVPTGFPWPDDYISRPHGFDILYIQDYIAEATRSTIILCSTGIAFLIAAILWTVGVAIRDTRTQKPTSALASKNTLNTFRMAVRKPAASRPSVL